MAKAKLRINIYDFTDFREFLKAAYEDLNAQSPAFSYRNLQKLAGYSPNSNHFWQVVHGHAALTPKAARAYGEALGLSQTKTAFLQALAALNQAKTDKERDFCLKQLKSYKGFQTHARTALLRHEFYSKWYLPALRELVALDDFIEDAQWMATRLSPPLSRAKVEKGIEKLLELGYLTRDDSGKLQQATPIIGSFADRKDDDEFAKLAVRNFHRKMMELGADSLERYGQQERYIAGITMAISKNQAEGVRRLTEDYLARVQQYIVEDEPIEVVYRLNSQLFPLSTLSGEKKEAFAEPSNKERLQ